MLSSITNTLLLFEIPSGFEWVVIIAVVVLLFGGKKIPELMRGMGRGIREFNDAKTNIKKEIEDGMKESKEEPKEESKPTPHQINQRENA